MRYNHYIIYLFTIIRSNKVIVGNFTYITILQLFLLVTPLITYPYLVGVLGMELYGTIVTAQVLASYCSLIIGFGSDSVCAKHISIQSSNYQKMSEIVCGVFLLRFIMFVICIPLYIAVVFLVPSFHSHFELFLLMYGLTLNDLLFPQYFFQGVERMKFITYTSIFVKAFFILLIFAFVKEKSDYILIPLFYFAGALFSGLISIASLFFKFNIRLRMPELYYFRYLVKDCLPVFSTDIICTIKDKLCYMLIGSTIGMSEVTIYDLAIKLNTIVSKPTTIFSTVLLPHFAKTRNINKIKKTIMAIMCFTLCVVIVANVFLDDIVLFFLKEHIDILPIRLLLLAPIILSVSVTIYYNVFIALGYNRYVLYSIIVTTLVYVLLLLIVWAGGFLSSLYSYIIIALIAFLVEMIYRLVKFRKIAINEQGY